MKVVLLKYDELWLKSTQVRKRMINYLVDHLKFLGFKNLKIDREGIKLYETNEVKNIAKLKAVPGVSKIEVRDVYEFKNKQDLVDIVVDYALTKVKEFEKFGIRVKRKHKNHEFSSREIEREAGSIIVKKINKKIDLKNPDVWVKVEVYGREMHIITEEYEGMGGLPYGCEGSCKINEESYYLIKEVLKRGIYIINLPKRLRLLYPLRSYDQKFEVVFHALCFEDLNKIKEIEGGSQKSFNLYPFVALSTREFLIQEKKAREFFKSLL